MSLGNFLITDFEWFYKFLFNNEPTNSVEAHGWIKEERETMVLHEIND
jgi:hypothetical protein